MTKNFKKFLTFSIFLPFFWSFQSEPIFANTENICTIQNWPIKDMTDYAQKINRELSEIRQKSTPAADCRPIVNASYVIFDAAKADLSAMRHTFTDFRYNIGAIKNAWKNPYVKRDEKFFYNIEKQIERQIDALGRECRLNDENRKQLHAIVMEVQTLQNAYQNAALGTPLDNFSGIRADNIELAKNIETNYHPNKTKSCIPNDKNQQKFGESLKNMINIGGKMDDSLSTWRRAIALIQGGWQGMSESEVVAKERQLLEAELSRQWLSQNAKNTMLQNFNCYKSKTLGENNTENILEARASCLQFPVAWVENIFGLKTAGREILQNGRETWNNFTWKAGTTDVYEQRFQAAKKRESRSLNIVEMYDQLELLSSTDIDNTTTSQKGLIDLHLRLLETNTLLETRIPVMQKNCMKWNPGLVGGCR